VCRDGEELVARAHGGLQICQRLPPLAAHARLAQLAVDGRSQPAMFPLTMKSLAPALSARTGALLADGPERMMKGTSSPACCTMASAAMALNEGIDQSENHHVEGVRGERVAQARIGIDAEQGGGVAERCSSTSSSSKSSMVSSRTRMRSSPKMRLKIA